MIPAKILEMVFRAFFNHPKVKELFRYKDEPNELDLGMKDLGIGMKDLEKKVTGDGFRITAAVDMMKGYAETIDKLTEDLKSANKVIDRFDDKLQQINKIAHPQAIDLDEWEQVKADMKKIRNKGVFKKLG